MSDTAGVLLVARSTGRALFLRRTRSGIWDLPGGHADPGDASAVATAMRELTEETGFDRELVMAKPRYRVSWCRQGMVFGHIWPECPSRYTGFVAYIPKEFRAVLDAEHTASAWHEITSPPRRIVAGLDWMLGWARTMNLA